MKFILHAQRETPRFQGMKSSCDFSSAFNSGFRFSAANHAAILTSSRPSSRSLQLCSARNVGENRSAYTGFELFDRLVRGSE
jgi:hypothetical protein